MIPAPPGGILARYKYDHNGRSYYDEKPVIAFDDDGSALVLGDRCLVPADHCSNFAGFDAAGGYVALIPAGGWRVEFRGKDGSTYSESLVGWGLKPDGTVAPFTTDCDGLIQNLHEYPDRYRVYHRDTAETSAAPGGSELPGADDRSPHSDLSER